MDRQANISNQENRYRSTCYIRVHNCVRRCTELYRYVLREEKRRDREETEKETALIVNPLLNQDAFNEWLNHKNYKSKGAITKTSNFLCKYSFEVQQQIVDTSMMNNYKGLFEPKQSNQQKQKPISFQEQERQKTQQIGKAVMSGFDPFDPKNYEQQNTQEYLDAEIQS